MHTLQCYYILLGSHRGNEQQNRNPFLQDGWGKGSSPVH